MARKQNKFPAGRTFYDHRTECLLNALALASKAQLRLAKMLREQQCPLPTQRWPQRIAAAAKELLVAAQWLEGTEAYEDEDQRDRVK